MLFHIIIVTGMAMTYLLPTAFAAVMWTGNSTLEAREPGRKKPAGPIGTTMWAQFCDDDNCAERCGMSINVGDSGCLQQRHRRSIRFHGEITDYHFLVVSPGNLCGCQVRCERVHTLGRHTSAELVPNGHVHDYCWNIAAHGYDKALSFRWLERESCGPNQCNWDGSPLA